MALTKISTQFINTVGEGSLGQVLTADENGVFNWVSSTALEVSAGNITGTVPTAEIADTITASAQPNITSVGTLVELTVAGNANLGNLSAANATFTNIAGNGTGITTIAGANVTGTVGSASTANTANTANTAATVTTAAQPNITSVGTLTTLATSGDVTVGGNLTVNGTTTTVNSTEVDIADKNIVLAYGSTTAAQANGGGITLQGAGATIIYTSANDAWNINKTIIGNLSGAATTAATVTTNAQPNITSIGNLASLTVSNIATFTSNATTFTQQIVVSPFETTVTASIVPDMGLQVSDSDFPANVTSISAINSKIYGTLNVVGETQLLAFKETATGTVNTGTSIAPDLSAGTIRHYTANANFTFNGFTNATAGQSATIIITQDATGSRVMTSTMKFVGGNKTLSTTPGAIDMVAVVYTGVYYLASLTKGYV